MTNMMYALYKLMFVKRLGHPRWYYKRIRVWHQNIFGFLRCGENEALWAISKFPCFSWKISHEKDQKLSYKREQTKIPITMMVGNILWTTREGAGWGGEKFQIGKGQLEMFEKRKNAKSKCLQAHSTRGMRCYNQKLEFTKSRHHQVVTKETIRGYDGA